MQMWSGRKPGRSDGPNDLSALHCLTGTYGHAQLVSVTASEATTVPDGDQVSVAAVPSCLDDYAAIHCPDRRPGGSANIGTRVAAGITKDGV